VSASELDRLTEVLDCSVRAAGGEQRLRSVLPHDGLPAGSSALRNEADRLYRIAIDHRDCKCWNRPAVPSNPATHPRASGCEM